MEHKEFDNKANRRDIEEDVFKSFDNRKNRSDITEEED
jgi:hypothetical protein